MTESEAFKRGISPQSAWPFATGADQVTDYLKPLREALEAGPTCGPWKSVHGYHEDYVYATDARYPTLPGNPSPVKVAWLPPYPNRPDIPARDADYIAAANPDTIRTILAERDALREALTESLRVMEEWQVGQSVREQATRALALTTPRN